MVIHLQRIKSISKTNWKRFFSKNVNLTGKYKSKSLSYKNYEMIPQSVRSFCLEHFGLDIEEDADAKNMSKKVCQKKYDKKSMTKKIWQKKVWQKKWQQRESDKKSVKK